MIPVTIDLNGSRRTLFVARYETTWEQYLLAVDEANCPRPRNLSPKPVDLGDPGVRDDFPMTSITPGEIQCFVDWLRRKTGKPFRLPTAAEWEAVARIGRGSAPLPAASVPESDGYLMNRLSTFPVRPRESREAVSNRIVTRVGSFRPSASGIHDLIGNAAEVVSDPVPPLRNLADPHRPLRLVKVKGGHLGSFPDDDLLGGEKKVFAHLISRQVGFRLVYSES